MKKREKEKFYMYIYADLLGSASEIVYQVDYEGRYYLKERFLKKLKYYQFSSQIIKIIDDHLTELVAEASEFDRYVIMYNRIVHLIVGYFESI